MNTQELISQLLKRLNRFKFIILAGGFILAVSCYIYAKKQLAVYTVNASLFPLITSQESNSASSKISELIGGGGSSKNLSEDANVSIEDVAKSTKTRIAVVSERLPEYGNKMIAEILIKEYNENHPFLAGAIKMPSADADKADIAAELIVPRYEVKFTKTGLLNVTFSGPDKRLLIPVDNIFISKITRFYKELKIEKAKADFDFIQAKVDSFDNVITGYDKQRIRLNNTTLFVPSDRLQYQLPKENLDNDKLLVLGQRNAAAANREEALWRLQKVTPIIKVLDEPKINNTPQKPSAPVYAIAGLVIGSLVFAFVFVFGILYRYVTNMINTAIAPQKIDPNTSITA